ncbi:hypothetical protein [Methylorubrum populi]|nr:hypothetical protein [Methylorubrum populi]
MAALLATAPGAQAAPFDNLKDDFAACLRFELDGARGPRHGAATAKTERALQRCAGEMDRLERADPRRLRSDRGLSPSTWAVIESVFGPGSRGRLSGLRF